MSNYQSIPALWDIATFSSDIYSIEHFFANSTNNNSTFKNSTNTPTSTAFSAYKINVLAFNSAFLLCYLILAFISIASYVMQFKHMKRNQHVLFWILFTLEGLVLPGMLTRLGSEFGFLHPVLNEGRTITILIKTFDRGFNVLILYVEVVCMTFITFVFLQTTRAINAITAETFSKARIAIIAFIILLGAAFVIMYLLTMILGGVTVAALNPASGISADAANYFLLAMYLVATLLFMIASILTSVFINIIGTKLIQSLRQGRERVKSMMAKGNGSNNGTLNSKSQEQIRTFEQKRIALKKTMAIQIGMTVCLFFQVFGAIFIAINIAWSMAILIFQCFFSISSIAFISLILAIYSPLREVQKLFRADSNSSLNSATTTGKQQPHHRKDNHADRTDEDLANSSSVVIHDESEIAIVDDELKDPQVKHVKIVDQFEEGTMVGATTTTTPHGAMSTSSNTAMMMMTIPRELLEADKISTPTLVEMELVQHQQEAHERETSSSSDTDTPPGVTMV
ncbi:hypothetical protein C9374_012250 [Naegleria lovaniensis]|uniref:Uncharacterized protein n=1 Tax=Naegleria lovaniensis TaxID=51637 RepID=A0AA88KE06_NAELO|nr:uncharacterized protein C9374_012250 [Naegleria lovaniensis]KAG2373384.1 hypothetical protein C9374_012250 [Naegleria lovaniensis]